MKLLSALLIILVSCGPADNPQEAKPEIIRGLSSNFEEGTAQLTKRAQVAFPTDSSENNLLERLKRQGFTEFSSDSDEQGVWHAAEFEERRFPCITGWSIRWRSKDKRITDVWAVFGAACL
ncbi:MAG: hypothetical protein EOP62_15670 [Sphingomonadales bacterium]|nr:MAG: hypothetical protein EOP62_15670 [Sphingomonadales bacterium]